MMARMFRCESKWGCRVVSLAGLLKVTASLIACVVISGTMYSTVLAAEPHEDPEAVEQTFSGISLLRYYADALHFVLNKQPEEVKARLDKMPFVNVPHDMKELVDDFTVASLDMAWFLLDIDEDLNLMKQKTQKKKKS